MQRIPTLDGWRGVAILLVLSDHALRFSRNPILTGLGQQGVTIFFVLSGYLITTLLLHEQKKTGNIDLLAFYRRRFFRLMPAAWTFLLFAGAITYVQHRGGWADLIACVFFYRNFIDLNGLHQLTGHFWTLSMEEQFYLVWPAALLLLRRRQAIAFLVCGAATVAVLRVVTFQPGHVFPLMYPFQTQFRADALLVGSLSAMLAPQTVRFLRSWMLVPLTLLFIVFVGLHRSETIPLYECVAIALLLLLTSQNPQSPISRLLCQPPLRWLGVISYSIYLWQQPVFLSVPGGLPLAYGFILIGVLAFFSYVLIEAPARQLNRHPSAKSPLSQGLESPLG